MVISERPPPLSLCFSLRDFNGSEGMRSALGLSLILHRVHGRKQERSIRVCKPKHTYVLLTRHFNVRAPASALFCHDVVAFCAYDVSRDAYHLGQTLTLCRFPFSGFAISGLPSADHEVSRGGELRALPPYLNPSTPVTSLGIILPKRSFQINSPREIRARGAILFSLGIISGLIVLRLWACMYVTVVLNLGQSSLTVGELTPFSFI